MSRLGDCLWSAMVHLVCDGASEGGAVSGSAGRLPKATREQRSEASSAPPPGHPRMRPASGERSDPRSERAVVLPTEAEERRCTWLTVGSCCRCGSCGDPD